MPNPSSHVSCTMLAALPIFEGLEASKLETLRELASVLEVPSETKLLEQGQPAEAFHVVLSGRLKLCLELAEGTEVCMLTLTAGEVLGWSGLLNQDCWLASATALKPSRVLSFHGPALRQACERDHELGYFVMRNLFSAISARLHDTRLQLLDMYGHG